MIYLFLKILQVVVTEHSFNHFLRKVIKYCQADNLLELEIVIKPINNEPYEDIQWFGNFDESWLVLDIENGLREQIQPFFRQLNRLTLCALKKTRLNPTFFAQIDLPSLRKCKIVNISTKLHWSGIFPWEMCTNITELRLMNFDLHDDESIDEFDEFLIQIPNLQVFIHTNGKLGFLPVAELLLERFPNLRSFGYCDYDINGPAFEDNFKILGRFTNLTEFHLKNFESMKFHKILQFLPHIKVLSIWQVKQFHQSPVESRRIVQTIKSIISARRALAPPHDRIHLLVNQWQYNDFKAIQNTDDILHMTIVD